MPIYEYECLSCGKTVEIIQKFSDEPLTRCEVCSGELRKVLSAPALQFKGSGWYVTDYAGNKRSNDGSEPAPKNEGSKTTEEASKKKPADSSTTSGDSSSKAS